jgi:hypothetical protein
MVGKESINSDSGSSPYKRKKLKEKRKKKKEKRKKKKPRFVHVSVQGSLAMV